MVFDGISRDSFHKIFDSQVGDVEILDFVNGAFMDDAVDIRNENNRGEGIPSKIAETGV